MRWLGVVVAMIACSAPSPPARAPATSAPAERVPAERLEIDVTPAPDTGCDSATPVRATYRAIDPSGRFGLRDALGILSNPAVPVEVKREQVARLRAWLDGLTDVELERARREITTTGNCVADALLLGEGLISSFKPFDRRPLYAICVGLVTWGPSSETVRTHISEVGLFVVDRASSSKATKTEHANRPGFTFPFDDEVLIALQGCFETTCRVPGTDLEYTFELVSEDDRTVLRRMERQRAAPCHPP